MNQNFLKIDEAAKFLGISKSTLYKITAPNVKVGVKSNLKSIPHYRFGKRLLFDKDELVEYIKGGRVIQMELPKDEFELIKLPSLTA